MIRASFEGPDLPLPAVHPGRQRDPADRRPRDLGLREEAGRLRAQLGRRRRALRRADDLHRAAPRRGAADDRDDGRRPPRRPGRAGRHRCPGPLLPDHPQLRGRTSAPSVAELVRLDVPATLHKAQDGTPRLFAGRGSLTIPDRSPSVDPWHLLAPKRIVDCYFGVYDFDLPHGKVIHDYLAGRRDLGGRREGEPGDGVGPRRDEARSTFGPAAPSRSS